MTNNNSLEGILHLFSETGTEGGHWAFQDKRFITKIPPPFGVFSNQTVWDSNDPARRGQTQDKAEVFLNNEWLPLPDPMQEESDFYVSSLFKGEDRGDHEADKRLMEKYGFKIKYAADRMNEEYGKGNWHLEDPSTAIVPDGTRVHYGGTPPTQPDRPYGIPANGLTKVTVKWDDGIVDQARLSNTLLATSWSYDGLHCLSDGDQLTIYHPESKNEVWSGVINLKRHKLFTEHSQGLYIHADQIDVDRETWSGYFFNEYPAKLTRMT